MQMRGYNDRDEHDVIALQYIEHSINENAVFYTFDGRIKLPKNIHKKTISRNFCSFGWKIQKNAVGFTQIAARKMIIAKIFFYDSF